MGLPDLEACLPAETLEIEEVVREHRLAFQHVEAVAAEATTQRDDHPITAAPGVFSPGERVAKSPSIQRRQTAARWSSRAQSPGVARQNRTHSGGIEQLPLDLDDFTLRVPLVNPGDCRVKGSPWQFDLQLRLSLR